MKRQVVTKSQTIEFIDEAVPEITDNEVLIKIMRIGICGSDIHVYYGKHPNTTFPVTQGHEVSGIIEKVGKNVNDFKLGDKVTIQPQITCGKCYPCMNGMYHICNSLQVMGFQAPGTAVEYFKCNEKYVLKLPNEMSFDEGAMVEPTAVACSSIRKIGDIRGKDIIILGAGPIGNLTAQTAKALGAKNVLITEINDFRLKLAEKVGIDNIVNPLEKDLAEEIESVFGPKKADIIFECVGASETVKQALNIARKGAIIVLVGVYSEQPSIDLNIIQNSELSLVGTLMYQKEDYLQAIELIKNGEIEVKELITNHFPFLEYDEAYRFIENNKGNVMKVLIDVH